jgi:nucleotide-binding universal stress UspA family protein
MYGSVLVPLDGSGYAEKALSHATRLTRQGGTLTLLRVAHTIEELVGARQPDLTRGAATTEDVLARQQYDEERAAAAAYLDEAKKLVAGGQFETAVMLAEGDPASQILRVANETGADLIVLTAFGLSASKTPAKTGVFGRVADAVLEGARAPVLVVKPWD